MALENVKRIKQRFYTYAYLNKNKKPYYIGKGQGLRAWKSGGRGCPTPKDSSKILILKKGLTEEQAFSHEKYMISILGRRNLNTGILLNLTNGGEGSSGRFLSEYTRNKIRKSVLGFKHSKEARIKMSKASLGRKQSEISKIKRSLSMRGKNKGKIKSASTKEKLSKTLLSKQRSKYIYEIIIDGKPVIVKSLSLFCKTYSWINFSSFLKAAKEGRKYKNHPVRILKCLK